MSTILAVLAGFLPTNGATFATTVGARRSRPMADWLDPASQWNVAGIIRAAMLSDIRLCASLILLLLWLTPVDAVTALLRAHGSEALAVAPAPPMEWLVSATLIVAHVFPLILIAYFAKARWQYVSIDVRIVAPLLLAACCFISWDLNDAALPAIGFMFGFGVVGYVMIRCSFDRSLMFYAFVIGPAFEENIRRSLLISRGEPSVYLTRPISAALLIAGVLVFIVVRALRYRARVARA